MASWVLTAGLQNLRAQVNAAFPSRDKASDGTIGDTAHQAGVSGHNPDDTAGSRPAWNGDPDTTPEVRSWDCDSDLGDSQVSAQDLVDHIRRLPGVASVLRYMIYNRRMYHSRDGWAPTPYTGVSAHTEHIHFEGAWSQVADTDKTFDYRLEDLMPTAQEIADAVWAKALADPAKPGATKKAGDYQRYNDVVNRNSIADFFFGAFHAATQDDVYDSADADTQKSWRNARDTLRGVVGGPVDQAAIVAAIAANRVDPAAVVAGVLAGLGPSADPAQFAAAVVELLPPLPAPQADQAKAFADELAARLAA